MSNGDFIKACALRDVPTDGRPHVLKMLGKRLGVFRMGDEVRALEMTCKHQGADLSKGEMVDGVVTCPRHGWRYDLKTGECLEPPQGIPLRKHAVKIEGEMVWISVRPDSQLGLW